MNEGADQHNATGNGPAGRVALVTGAGSGMGRATALALAARGATVLATDIDGASAERTAAEARAGGGRAVPARIDVTDAAAVGAGVAALAAAHGPVDVAVCCAGIGNFAPLAELDVADADAVLAVSLGGTVAVARAVLPAMRERGWGRLVAFSSLNAKTPPAGLAHYSAAKAALIGWAQAVALEEAPAVTVNCVCPGMVDTSIFLADLEHARRSDPAATLEGVKADAAREIPAGRLGRPEEVAELVAYLASDAAAFVTGQALNISGGQEMG